MFLRIALVAVLALLTTGFTYEDLQVDFGGVGDGTTNDSTAFANAITTIDAASCPSLFVPAGRYSLPTFTQTTIDDCLVIHGDGPDRSVLDFEGFNTAGGLFILDGPLRVEFKDIRIVDIGRELLQFEDNRTATTSTIRFSNVVIEDVGATANNSAVIRDDANDSNHSIETFQAVDVLLVDSGALLKTTYADWEDVFMNRIRVTQGKGADALATFADPGLAKHVFLRDISIHDHNPNSSSVMRGMSIEAEEVTIDGVVCRDNSNGTSGGTEGCIRIGGGDRGKVTISNVQIFNHTGGDAGDEGILIKPKYENSATPVALSNFTIVNETNDLGTGVSVVGSSHTTITNGTVSGYARCLNLSTGTGDQEDWTISNLNCRDIHTEDSPAAIEVRMGQRLQITNSVIQAVGRSAAGAFSAVEVRCEDSQGCESFQFSNNTIDTVTDGGGGAVSRGIWFKENSSTGHISDAMVTFNRFDTMDAGVEITSGTKDVSNLLTFGNMFRNVTDPCKNFEADMSCYVVDKSTSRIYRDADGDGTKDAGEAYIAP